MNVRLTIVVIIAIFLVITSGISVFAYKISNKQISDISKEIYFFHNKNVNITYYNITVQEAWELLTNTSNGIQIPIDIRSDEEWNEGFLDTPYPENPTHFSLELIKTEDGLVEFLETFEGKEIIPYENNNAYRLFLLLNILCNADYKGTIYIMGGGINEWKNSGLPIRTNNPPNIPHIDGPKEITTGKNISYTFSTVDPDNDIIYFIIDWGDGNTEITKLYSASGEDVIVNHSWNEEGSYKILAKAIDLFNYESDLAEFEIQVLKTRVSHNSFFLQFFNKHSLPENPFNY
jgi:hypothetical protein